MSKTLTTPKAGKGVKPQELSFIPGGNAKWYGHFESGLAISYTLNVVLSYNPETVLLGIDTKTFVHAKTCMWMFICLYPKLPQTGSTQVVL